MDIFQLKFYFFEGSWIKFFLFFVLVILLSAIITTIRLEKNLNFKITVKDGASIVISVDDYISNTKRYHNASCIFGCNTQFNLSLVKKDSLQHDFVYKYLNKNLAQIQKEIDTSLNIPKENMENNRPIYPAGTVCCLAFQDSASTETRKLYLFANSYQREFNEYNGTDITGKALQNIWKFCEQHNIEDQYLLIPLLGTGHSKDLSPMSSAKAIIDTYFKNTFSSDKTSIHNIIISIPPSRLEELDIIKIKKYIEFKIMEAKFVQ